VQFAIQTATTTAAVQVAIQTATTTAAVQVAIQTATTLIFLSNYILHIV
jgi:hypothetical protein